MIENDNIVFPARCKPLPPGYRIVQLDSGHFLWVKDVGVNSNGGPIEGLICWDRWWVRRCVFAHFEETRS